jgi:(p)ppGpp synthase/HD superfamily hydrolase
VRVGGGQTPSAHCSTEVKTYNLQNEDKEMDDHDREMNDEEMKQWARNEVEHFEQFKNVDHASRLAKAVHHGQTDSAGIDYMNHIEAVVKSVRPLGYLFVIVAYLHDAIEDTKHKKKRKALKELILESFGSQIFDAVIAITKRPDQDYFKDYLPQVANNPVALVVKVADMQVNLDRSLKEQVNLARGLKEEDEDPNNKLRLLRISKYQAGLEYFGSMIATRYHMEEN